MAAEVGRQIGVVVGQRDGDLDRDAEPRPSERGSSSSAVRSVSPRPGRGQPAQRPEAQPRAQELGVEALGDGERAPGADDAPQRGAHQLGLLEAVAQERLDLVARRQVEIGAERDQVAHLRVVEQVAEHREHAVAVKIRGDGDAAAPRVQQVRGDLDELALDRLPRRPERDQPDVAVGVDGGEPVRVVERLEVQPLSCR